MKWLIHVRYYYYEHIYMVRVVKINYCAPACTESMLLAAHSLKARVFIISNAGCSAVYFSYFCRSPIKFFTAKHLGLGGIKSQQLYSHTLKLKVNSDA